MKFFSFALNIFILTNLSGAFAHAIDVHAPCNPYKGKTIPSLRACGDINNSDKKKRGFLAEDYVETVGTKEKRHLGVLPSLQEEIKKHFEKVYQMSANPNNFIQATPLSGAPPANSELTQDPRILYVPFKFGKVCNQSPSAYNKVPGRADGPSGCGNSIRLGVSASVPQVCSTCTCRDINCAARGFNKTVRLENEARGPGGDRYGSLETAYLRGGWVRTTECTLKQVTEEIKRSSRISNVSSPCRYMSGLIDSYLQRLEQQSKTNKNETEITQCEDTAWLDQTRGVDDADIRQSAQFLCATRAGVEALFKNLVVCETLERSQAKYASALPGGATAFLKQIQGKISTGDLYTECQALGFSPNQENTGVQQCFRNCIRETCSRDRGMIDGCSTTVNSASCNSCLDTVLTQSYNTCYQRWYPDFISKKFSRFDLSGSECR